MKSKQKKHNSLKLGYLLFLELAYFIDLLYSLIDIGKELVKYSPGQEKISGSWERWKPLKHTLPQITCSWRRKPGEKCTCES